MGRTSKSSYWNAPVVSFQRVNDVIHGRRAMTASTALRRARFFGTTAEFWMYAQLAWDLYEVAWKERSAMERIEPISSVHR